MSTKCWNIKKNITCVTLQILTSRTLIFFRADIQSDVQKFMNYRVHPWGRSLCFWEPAERRRHCGPSAGGWWPAAAASQTNSSPGRGAPSHAWKQHHIHTYITKENWCWSIAFFITIDSDVLSVSTLKRKQEPKNQTYKGRRLFSRSTHKPSL